MPGVALARRSLTCPLHHFDESRSQEMLDSGASARRNRDKRFGSNQRGDQDWRNIAISLIYRDAQPFSLGLVFYNHTVKTVNPLGAIIAGILCTWASFTFLRGSLTGAPPMYSHGWVQRGLHFIAGIIFASLAVGALLMLTGKWHPR